MTDALTITLQAALGDAYRIERELSPGGMSRIFLATESSLGRTVVVKVLPAELANEVSASRFRREIEIAARLQHPHILPVLTAGVSGSLLYFVMPYVAGESLRHRLSRERQLPIADARRILQEIADALAYAHANGVVHRDVKPENILLESGHAVLADFGVARALLQASSEGSLTATGLGIGTPGYMAPEQAAGERSVDARADVYALAVVGYEMIGGLPPFSGPSAQAVIAAHLTSQPRALRELRPDVPSSVVATLERGMAKLPDQRFQTAAEFRDAIAGSAGRAPNRRAILAGTVVGIVAIAVAAIIGTRDPPTVHMDPDLLAVAPPDVSDSSLSSLGENLVDVVSRSLDGAGTLRTVSPSVVFRRWTGRADQASASRFGQAAGAGLALVGSVIRAGADSVRLNASVFDVAGGRSMGELEFLEAADRSDRIADSLSVGVLRILGRAQRAGTGGFSSLGTKSLQAGKAFLRGEQLYRRAAWDSAVAAYQGAFSFDTAFALAYNHAAHARGWQVNEGDDSVTAWRLRAGRLAKGLSLRDSLLLLADSLRAANVQSGPPDVLGQTRRSIRQFSLLEQLTARYPDDAEMWYDLGDAYYHSGVGLSSVSDERMLSVFEKAVTLDSTFAPAYPHLITIALRVFRDTTRALQYADRYVALSSPGTQHESSRLLLTLLRQPANDAAELRARLRSVRREVRFGALSALTRFPDRAETSVRAARAMVSNTGNSADTLPLGRFQAAEILAWRGHLDEAYRALGDSDRSPAAADAFVLGVQPTGSATDVIRRWSFQQLGSMPPGYLMALLPWLAQQHDTVSIRGLLDFWAGLGRRMTTMPMPPPARANAFATLRLIAMAGGAYLDLSRADTAQALRQFKAVPDSMCAILCAELKLTTAQLLMSRGRYQEADSLLSRRWAIEIRTLELVQALERGRVSEQLGKRKEAIDSYTLVIDAWANGDSLVQPAVRAARDGLRRLGAEPSAPRTVRP